MQYRVVAAVLAIVTLSACSSSASPTPVSLAGGNCPDEVIIQSWWTPQAENGYLYYGLLAPGDNPTYSVDAARKVVSGPLYDAGRPTGLRMSIRAGGPIQHYQQAPQLMATDRRILIGQVATLEDQIVAYSQRGQATTAIFAPLVRDPRAIMWDRAQHPEIHTLPDVGNSGIPVYAVGGAVSTEYLVKSGTLREGQIDTSDGNATYRLMLHRSAATTGYVTNEVLEFRAKGVKIDFAMLDAKFPTYSNLLVVSQRTLTEGATCLRRLVPILQRNLAAFVAQPQRAMRFVSELNALYKRDPYPVSHGIQAISEGTDRGIFANGPSGIAGELEPGRVQAVVNAVRSIRPGLPEITPQQLMTNEFLDRTVTLAP